MKRILAHNAVIREELETFLRAKRAASGPLTPWKTDFLDRLLPFATTGKLLRGSLVCFAYETFSGQPADDTVIKAAMAVELTHSALLIHDDIMDDDAIRRGQPSFHQQYRTLGAEEGLAQADHFGDGMAMCAGDAALFMGFELMAGCDPVAQRLFTDQMVTTCAGQMQDLYLEARSAVPSKKAIYDLMETKTASYTLALPLAMGAALAGQPAATLARLRDIGIDAGIIFQIRDDELGVMGDSRETGKPVGSDIIEGKKTLLLYHLLERCGAKEQLAVRNIFGNPDAGPEDIAYVQELVTRLGVTRLLNDEISRLEKRAGAATAKLDADEKAREELLELIRFCGTRRA